MRTAFDDLVARARDVPIDAEVWRRGIRLKKSGNGLVGPCPVCGGDDRFSINKKKQFFYCRICEVGGNVIALVEHLDGVDFKTAVKTLINDDRPRTAPVARPTKTDEDEKLKYEIAMRIWRDARAAVGTLVETYLKSRCITIPPPPSLRFEPRLMHTGWRHNLKIISFHPGMVALVTRGTDGEPVAIHRTFLARDGSGKAPVEPQKMMLGPCSGGAVRLAPATDFLMVGEGIETCLAAMQATGSPAWSALSTSGLHALGLPDDVRRVTILADGDDAGEAAALDAGRRWKREGRVVRIARPPPNKDFADMLREEAAP